MPVPDSSQAGQTDQPIDETVDVPAQTPDEGSATEEQQPEQTFTRADVEKMLADAETRFTRMVQSQVAKSESRTSQNIQKQLAALEAIRPSLNMSDADYEAAQNKIIREEQIKEFKPQSPTGSGNQQPAPDLNEAERFVSSQIDMVFQSAGVRVTPDDAEFKLIEQAWNDPKGSLAKTLIAANQAATQKAIRLSALKGNASARSGVGGGNAATSSAYDPNKPASYYLEKAAQEPKKK